MEEQLAREMNKVKITNQRSNVEVQRVCQGSEDLKVLQDKIKAAYLNKERTA